MKNLLLLIFAVCSSVLAYSQNLVPNPSFEDTVACPHVSSNEVNLATGWSSYRASPDYFNSCNDIAPNVPDAFGGYQFAASGEAYCGMYTFLSFANASKEYLGCKLLSDLIVGNKYYISFKTSFGDSVNCAVNKLGMLFSTVTYNWMYSWAPIINNANLYSNDIIYEHEKWVTISGSFIADSAYKYLIIGNFFDNDSINVDTLFNMAGNYCYSYYYIDDVCVTEDSLGCDFTISNNIENYNEMIKIYPTIVSDKMYINNTTSNRIQLSIINNIGNLIKKVTLNESFNEINLTELQKGFYIIKIETNKQIFTNKFIKL